MKRQVVWPRGRPTSCPQSFSGGPLMRTALLAVLGLALAFVTVAQAQDKEKKKEVTLKGTITCAKCDLGKEDKCTTVIVVKDKEKGEDVIYYLDKKSGQANHKEICRKAKEGTVKGTVTEKDGKKTITARVVEFKTE